jgi:hypothetical protein
VSARARHPTTRTGAVLTSQVRLRLSQRFAERLAKLYDTERICIESQSWEGFSRAFERWHTARWGAVDRVTPHEVALKLRRALDVMRLPWASAPTQVPLEDRPHIIETVRQNYLQRRALFLWEMDGSEATDPDTYGRALNDMRMAHYVGDDTFLAALAQQKQRKPTKGKGDRRLKYLLLLNWIPRCLWAFTTEGISALLQDHYPRSGGQAYRDKTVADCWRDLGLYHSSKPLWWGVAGQPPRLVPLR